MSRALRRHHRERLIARVKGFGEWYAERANRLYDTRKFCTCPVQGCGNPRRILRGQRWLTPQERRQDERARWEWLEEAGRLLWKSAKRKTESARNRQRSTPV